MAIRAIIFDFGRVISAQKPPSLFRSYEDALGLPRDTLNVLMFDSPAWQEALLGRRTYEDYWHAVGPLLGLTSPKAVDAFRRRYHADEAVNAGVREIIGRLHGRYRLAVLSNAPPGLAAWLADWGLLEFFDTVFCSGDEGVVKPDAAAFREVLRRLAVAPEEAVFIDDSAEHVAAARSLGMRGILFTTAEALDAALGELLPAEPLSRHAPGGRKAPNDSPESCSTGTARQGGECRENAAEEAEERCRMNPEPKQGDEQRGGREPR